MLNNLIYGIAVVSILFVCLGMVKIGFAADVEEFQESYEVTPGMKLNVENFNGKVEILGWNGDEVEVYAEKKTNHGKDELKKVKIDVEINDEIFIKSIGVDDAKVSVNYEIKVPPGIEIQNIETSNGKIEIENVKGEAKLHTSNGKVEVERLEGSVAVNTSNGKVEIEEVSGAVNVNTSNGKIEVENVKGVESLKTSNGKIQAEIAEIAGEKVELSSTNGNIEVYLAEYLDVELQADTSNGSITYEGLSINVLESEKHHLKGKMGEGKKKLIISTSNGKIEIEKLD
jgi:DUF4097 and DUF4098 domain-containing protein YvlB